MTCEHRNMEGYEFKMFAVGPRCTRDAAFTYEWGPDEVAVCAMHAEELPGDVVLTEVDDV